MSREGDFFSEVEESTNDRSCQHAIFFGPYLIKLTLLFHIGLLTVLQGSAKECSLGCVNSRPAARGSLEARFTQPRDHSSAEPCKSTLMGLHTQVSHSKYDLNTLDSVKVFTMPDEDGLSNSQIET